MTEKYLGSAKAMDIAKYFYGALLFIRRLHRRPTSFRIDNHEYLYFEHPYNGTWLNERAVEIPLAMSEIQSCSTERVLEVGNVLSHYFEVKHSVVDKYEKRKGVIPEDILDVTFDHKFYRIVSISTVEHVGWDEIPRAPEKCIRVLEKMKQMLADGGRLLITIPLGYNSYLDKLLFEGKLDYSQAYFMKRMNLHEWQQVKIDQILTSTYGEKYRSTDGLAICIWEKK